MKHISRYPHHLIPAAVLMLIFLFGSCSREERDILPTYGRVSIEDFSIGYSVDIGTVITKSEQTIEAENRVTNLYVFLYDSEGLLRRKKSYWVGESDVDGYDARIYSYSEKQTEDDASSYGFIPAFFMDNGSPVSLDDLHLGDGTNLSFYAVANFDGVTKDRLDGLQIASDRSVLLDMDVELGTDGSIDRQQFVMTAVAEAVNLAPAEDGTVSNVGVNLQLKRIDAKISFNLRLSVDEAVDGAASISQMQYRVHQVPDWSWLFPRDKGASSPNTWDASAFHEDQEPGSGYSCRYGDTYSTFDSTYTSVGPGGANLVTGGHFAFYLRENRPIADNPISSESRGDASSLYALREAWNGEDMPGTSVHGRDFTYAPDNATFVEISGRLSYRRYTADGNTENVNADVVYIIHLGETGNNPDDPEAVNNYDVRRNVRYIYNVTVRGINDLVVEVSEGRDQRPGAEGDVYLSTDRHYELDAHYGRLLLTLDRNSLAEGGWSIRSPLGIAVEGQDGNTLLNSTDYKWILFAINKEFGEGDDVMVKFPGIQAYDGGVDFFYGGSLRPAADLQRDLHSDMGNRLEYAGGTQTFKASLENENQDNYWAAYKNNVWSGACLRDINQLINYVKSNMDALFENDDKLMVTAFVDEFTYIYDPTREDYIHPGKSVIEAAGGNNEDARRRLLLWKQYVNTDGDRTISITPNTSTSVSPDGNTTLTNSFVSISQKSIKTIYNVENVETAWGLETTNETGRLDYEFSSSYYYPSAYKTNTTSDGRSNFLNFWLDRNGNSRFAWTDAMTTQTDVEDAEGLREDFRDAIHACISRNRDLNGNNRIDENEIYWYLAAKDQLSGLWIGQDALDESAWMYTGNGFELNHLVTSSYHTGSTMGGDDSNFWMLWAEEGASWGKLNGEDGRWKPAAYDYRCIRNLGIDISEEDQSPAHYARVTDEGSYGGYEYYELDMTRMNPNTLRSESDGGGISPYIQLDDERSQNNEPFRKFWAMKSFVPEDYGQFYGTWADVIEELEAHGNPCPNGWRVPNQREMLIMMSTLNMDYNEYGQGIDDVYWAGWNYMSGNSTVYVGLAVATTFSFNGVGLYADQVRPGFQISGSALQTSGSSDIANLMLITGDGSGDRVKLRCVRDVTD